MLCFPNHLSRLRVVTFLAGVLFLGDALAAGLNTELVRNGDAELGTTEGWESTGVDPTASRVAGFSGLSPWESLGGYAFTGGSGPAAGQTLTQDIDVSEVLGRRAGEPVVALFRLLLQSRRGSGTTDTARGSLVLLDASGVLLLTNSWVDTDFSGPSSVAGGDWESVSDVFILPDTATTARIILHASRIGGSFTDAYFDNISLRLFQMPFIAGARPAPPGFELVLVTTPGRTATLEFTPAPGIEVFSTAAPSFLATGTGFHLTNLIDLGATPGEPVRAYRLRED